MRKGWVIRMVKKRLLTGVLAAALAVGFLSGCGDTKPTDSNPGGADSSTAGVGFSEKQYDMGDKTIKLADSYWIGGETATAERNECAKALEAIEKDYNCKIEVFAPNTSSINKDITANVAAGKVYANIINLQHEFSEVFRSGNIADVSTIKNLGLNSNRWLSVGTDFNTVNRVQYGVAFLERQCQTINWNVLTYNKTLAESYGIEDLYQLVRDKKWTFDKFAEICQTVTAKSNGAVKGMINGYPCFGFFLSANDVDYVVQKDGRYTYNGLSDKLLNALQFCQNFNKNGLLDMADFVGDDYGLKESNVFMDRKVFFHLSDFWVVSEVFSSGMPDDYGVLPLPMGPDAQDYIGLATNCKSFCFIKGDPDIEDAAAVLVAMANRTGITQEEWVKQQVENSLRDDESGEMLSLMLQNPVTTVYTDQLGSDWGTLLRTCIYDMSLTPRQAMEQAQQGAQSSIDEFFGQ